MKKVEVSIAQVQDVIKEIKLLENKKSNDTLRGYIAGAKWVLRALTNKEWGDE